MKKQKVKVTLVCSLDNHEALNAHSSRMTIVLKDEQMKKLSNPMQFTELELFKVLSENQIDIIHSLFGESQLFKDFHKAETRFVSSKLAYDKAKKNFSEHPDSLKMKVTLDTEEKSMKSAETKYEKAKELYENTNPDTFKILSIEPYVKSEN